MKIYLQCPSHTVLVQHAFDKFPNARAIVLFTPYVTPSGVQDCAMTKHVRPDCAEGDTMNFEHAYLWDLLKQDQAAWERAHASQTPEYVGAM